MDSHHSYSFFYHRFHYASIVTNVRLMYHLCRFFY